MKQESLPSLKTIYSALENAAVDLYGFSVSCRGGAPWLAEPDVLDTLLHGLESFWFLEDDTGGLSHREFREEFFKRLWEKSREVAAAAQVRIGTDVPLGHEEMAYYQLPQVARAALFLRTKKRFSYETISLILGVPEAVARTEVEKAREFLLGRRLRSVEWSEEDF